MHCAFAFPSLAWTVGTLFRWAGSARAIAKHTALPIMRPTIPAKALDRDAAYSATQSAKSPIMPAT